MAKIKIDKIYTSRRKSLTLRVNDDARLIVRAPLNMPVRSIRRFISKKRDWIKRKQHIIHKRSQKLKTRLFVNGEKFLYLGKWYEFKIVNRGDISLGAFLEFPEFLSNNAGEHLRRWYRSESFEKIPRRVSLYAGTYDIKYKSVKITSAVKRFASCGVKGSLNFSWRLIMAPLWVVDYVVVHELAHIRQRNHSRNFWSLVKQMFPGYRKSQDWLRQNSYLMRI